MLLFPLIVYIVSLKFFFTGEYLLWYSLAWLTFLDPIHGGIAAVIAVNVILTAYIIVAFFEEDDNRSPPISQRKNDWV